MFSCPPNSDHRLVDNLAADEDELFDSCSSSSHATPEAINKNIGCEPETSTNANLFCGESTVDGLRHDNIAQAYTLNPDIGIIDGDLPSLTVPPGFHDPSIANAPAFPFTYTPNSDTADLGDFGWANATDPNMVPFNESTWSGNDTILNSVSLMNEPMEVSPTENEPITSQAAYLVSENIGHNVEPGNSLSRGGTKWTPAMNESFLKHKYNRVKYEDIAIKMKAEFGVSLNPNILCKRFKTLANLALKDNIVKKALVQVAPQMLDAIHAEIEKTKTGDEQTLDKISQRMLQGLPEALETVAADLWIRAQGRRK